MAAAGTVVLTLTGSAGIAQAIPTASGAAARTVKVQIDGMNRDGKLVPASFAMLVSPSGQTTGFYRRSERVVPGPYLVGADFPTFGATDQQTSDTLVVRHIRITKAGPIVLNARDGKLLRVSLAGRSASQVSTSALACLDGNGAAGAFASGSARVYVVPFRSPLVQFQYLTDLAGRGGASYYLTRSHHNGIPSHPHFRQHAATMARVRTVVRSGIDPAYIWYWSVQPGPFPGSVCDESYAVNGSSQMPFSAVSYRTPGRWWTEIQTGEQYSGGERGRAFIYQARDYLPRHSYNDVMGAAVAGPRDDFPSMEGNIFNFTDYSLYSDPSDWPLGFRCCDVASAELKLGSHVIWHRRLGSRACGEICMQLTLRRAGWYTLAVRSQRWAPGHAEPPGLLSPNVSVAWRFHATPTPPAGQWRDFPVTETVFRPAGLDLSNDAAPSASTRLVVLVERAGDPNSPAARYRLKTVRVQDSTNDGKTWHTLRLVRHGSVWLTTVQDPASGYVALRSLVTDVHGDSTTQTIYRAYGIG